MLRPNGAHLFVRRKLAPVSLRKGSFKRGFFPGGQWITGWSSPANCRSMRASASCISGGRPRGFNRLIQKLRHGSILAFLPNPWKGFPGSLKDVISAEKKRVWINALDYEHNP
jgi:hypothetical protein